MSVMAYTPYGAAGIIIRVETDIRRGIPGIDITGLAEGAVREARERVRAAFRNSGFVFPADRILINLAPAGMRKDGAALDLPIALSVMAAAGLVPVTGDILVMGELELSGRIRPVRGVLAAIASGLDAGIGEFIVPAENSGEAAILAGCPQNPGVLSGGRAPARFAAVASLQEAAQILFIREQNGGLRPAAHTADAAAGTGSPAANGDFADVRGQGVYKRALEIAAAGGHNILVFGPPGAGKTMLARRLPSIMAPLSPDEAVEVTRLYSLAGPSRTGARENLSGSGAGNPLPTGKTTAPNTGGFIDSLITHPPFRAPHHSASAEGILGGGKNPHPGEISLAHFGVLFLDEAPEFRANILQALREPLEDRVISIARAEGPVRLPAEFQLVLAANACPCGRLGMRVSNGAPDNYFPTDDPADTPARRTDNSAVNSAFGSIQCFCSTEEIYRYWRKFGGALLDRIEIRAAVVPPKIGEMNGTRRVNGESQPLSRNGSGAARCLREETSAEIARRVSAAVEIQRGRFRGTAVRRNALIPAALMETMCPLSPRAQTAFQAALNHLGFSGRAYHGILRVARTIADLEAREIIDTEHILEAVQHRRPGEDPFEILGADS